MAARIDVDACKQFVDAVASRCSASGPAPAVITTHEPNWEGVTTSLTALSADFAYGAVLIGLVALVAALGWGLLVKMWAEREARQEAAKAAQKWLEDNAPALVRGYLELLHPVTPPASSEAADAADEIGKNA